MVAYLGKVKKYQRSIWTLLGPMVGFSERGCLLAKSIYRVFYVKFQDHAPTVVNHVDWGQVTSRYQIIAEEVLFVYKYNYVQTFF